MALKDDGQQIAIYNHTGGTDVALKAAAAGYRYVVTGLCLTLSVAGRVTVTFGDIASAYHVFSANLAANTATGFIPVFCPGAVNTALNITNTGGGVIDGWVRYEIRKG